MKVSINTECLNSKVFFMGFKETFWCFLTKKNCFKIMLMVQCPVMG